MHGHLTAIQKMKHFSRAAREAALVFSLLGAASCDRSPTRPERGPPGIRFVSGHLATDTVDAAIPELIVEVRDSAGMLQQDLVVRFAAASSSSGSSVLVGAGPGEYFSTSVRDTTDAQGRATARVRLGPIAGAGAVIVHVAELGLQDTVRFTILPGKAARLIAAPKDSAVYVDGTYTLRATVQDRHRNVRGDPVAFGAGASTQVNGNQLRGARIGRDLVVASIGSLVDTLWVSVVPRGTIAAAATNPSSGMPAVVSVGLDGSGARAMYEGKASAIDWHPSGSRFLFTAGHADQKIMMSDTAGSAWELPGTRGILDVWGAFSADGASVYLRLSGYLSRQPVDDGTPVHLYGSGGFAEFDDGKPSPSPDGTRLVFARGRLDPAPMEVLDVATRRAVSLGVHGRAPSWSPRGDLIAYLHAGSVRVIRPDGTGTRVVALPSSREEGFIPLLDWSPDGEWIITQTYPSNTLSLIHVRSGLVLPLPFSAGMSSPAWRP